MTLSAALLVAIQVTVVPPAARELDLSAALKVLEEPSLESLPAEGRTFRFIWLPPFPSMRLFAVRIEDVGKGPQLHWKAATWNSDWTGTVTVSGRRSVSPAEWDRLMEFRRGGFWNFIPQDYPRPSVVDGPIYVLEAAVWGERTRVLQHVPSPGPFRELCREMFLLSGMKTASSEGSLLLY